MSSKQSIDFESSSQGLFLDPSKYHFRLKDSSQESVQEGINELPFAQIHHKRLLPPPLPITAPPNWFQADISFYDNLAHYNHGYKSILNVIETTSRYVYSFPLKSKSDTLGAFRELIDSKIPIHAITTDKGKEFVNKQLRSLFDSNGIKYYETLSKNRMAIIERYNGTQRALIERLLTIEKGSKKQYNWVDSLVAITTNYNSAPHEHLEIDGEPHSPEQVYKSPTLMEAIHQRDLRQSYDLQNQLLTDNPIGQKVRLSRAKSAFDKGAIANFSASIYTIKDILLPATIIAANSEGKTKSIPYTNVLPIKSAIESPFKLKEEATKELAPKLKILKAQKRIAQSEAREGISKVNILETKRERKPSTRYSA